MTKAQRIAEVEERCVSENHNGDGMRCPDCTYDVAQIMYEEEA